MPANIKNNQFNFGFLNNNQDPIDVADSEATAIDSLEMDQLALGTLETSSYINVSSGPKDWTGDTTEVILGGRRFRLDPASKQLQMEKNAGSADWENVNDDPDSAGVVNPSAFPPKGTAPTLASKAGVKFTPQTGSTDIPLIAWRINPAATYTGLQTEGYIVEIDDDTPAAVTFRWKFNFDPVGFWREINKPILGGTYQSIFSNGVQVFFPTEANQTAGPSGPYVIGDTASTLVSKDVLSDGTYSYVIVNVKKTGVTPEVEIQSLPSSTAIATLANTDEAGQPVPNGPFITEVTYPALPTNTDEMWLFRKGPDDDEYFRIDVDAAGNKVLEDTIDLVGILPLILLESDDDESFYDLNLAIGNPSQEFVKLFEKDNRLWLVPSDREDLVLYSRLGAFWGWQRTNSFSFTGDITDLAQVRDPTVVGGEFTTVFATTQGIFHITGNGTEDAPYVRVAAVSDINVEANSLVDLNGMLMLMSKSTDQGYDTGPYGQKIYEYNLQNLIEVSARVKNSPVITSAAGVDYAEMRGSDKYLIKKTGVDEILMYHRDAQGWMQLDAAGEAGGWEWTSKHFTPVIFERLPIAYAKLIKFDYVGDLTVTFTLQGFVEAGPVVKTLNLVAGVRTKVRQRLPALRGQVWLVNFKANTAATKLYQAEYLS